MKFLYPIIFALFLSCSTEPEDCAGVAGGIAEEDMCGICDSDATNDCIQDCAGVWGGESVLSGCDNMCNSTKSLDECGECGGDNSTCSDDCGILFGSNFTCTGCKDLGAENYGDWLYPCEDCCYYDSINYDVSGDGNINILDVVDVVNKILSDIIPSENEDVIVNGIFDILDATIIMSFILSRSETATIVHFYFELLYPL